MRVTVLTHSPDGATSIRPLQHRLWPLVGISRHVPKVSVKFAYQGYWVKVKVTAAEKQKALVNPPSIPLFTCVHGLHQHH